MACTFNRCGFVRTDPDREDATVENAQRYGLGFRRRCWGEIREKRLKSGSSHLVGNDELGEELDGAAEQQAQSGHATRDLIACYCCCG